jgi:phosphatidylinositol-3-phosphatase
MDAWRPCCPVSIYQMHPINTRKKREKQMKKIFMFTIFCLLLTACAPGAVQSKVQLPTIGASITNPPAATDMPALPAAATTQAPQVSTPVMASDTPAATLTSGTGKVPNFDHIILIVLENEDYASVIGSSTMPHLNALATQYVLLTQDYAVRHPSLPNYLALVSGDTQKVTSDCSKCFVNAPNLADLIENSGRTWKAYEEDMPSPCFIGDSGKYAQKHNPFIYFDSIRTDPARCQRSIVPLTQLDADLKANLLPNFAFVMPNLCNSGHDCGLDIADNWVFQMVTKLQASPALGKNSLIIITFDEGNAKSTASCCGMGTKAGGQVATVLISPLAKPGFSDATPVSHYGLLKTILSAWGLPDLGNTSNPATQPVVQPWQ